MTTWSTEPGDHVERSSYFGTRSSGLVCLLHVAGAIADRYLAKQ